jgi:hypothetical protein
MDITIKKTQSFTVVPRSIAFQANAILDGTEILSMYGATENDAKRALITELKKIGNAIDDLITLDMIDSMS